MAILEQQAHEEAAFRDEPLPLLRPGLSENEIADLERLQETAFASELREFLQHWNRFEGITGFSLYGQDSWVEDELAEKGSFLMVGDYWRYACGDQVVMPLNGETDKVFLYLHEHGPKLEEFALSFSLALWRMAHE